MTRTIDKKEIITELFRRGRPVGFEKHHLVEGALLPVVSRTVDGQYTRRSIVHDDRKIWRPNGQKRKPWVLHPGKNLTEEEVQQLLGHLSSQVRSRRGRVNQFMVQMLLGTGLRASELCNLRVADTPVVLGDSVVWVKDGKGGRDRRVDIGKDLTEAIAYFVKKVRPSMVPRKYRKHDYQQVLLFNEHGKPYQREGLYYRLVRLGRRVGLLKTTGPHVFRHTFATSLYRATHDILYVSKQLGHAQIDTTSIYAKCDAADRQQILDELWSPSVGA